MADRREKAMEEVRSKEEEARRAEEDRIAAEKEFMERHERERRLSSQRTLSSTGVRGSYFSGTSSQAESESEAERKKRGRSSPDEKDKKKSKSRKTDDGDSEVDEEELGSEEGGPLDELWRVLQKMRGWFRQPTIMKMVTKPQTEKFQRYLAKYELELTKAREEKVRLETRAEERGEMADLMRSMVREEIRKSVVEEGPRKVASYADVASKRVPPQVPKVTGVKGPVLPAPKLVIVKHEAKESEEVKSMVKGLVNPRDIGLRVRRVINIRNGVIVEAENEEGAENLLKQKSLVEAGLTVEKPTKKRPVIMIYDVSANLKDEEIKQEVFYRNMQGSEIEEEQFKQEFEVRHRYKDVKSGGKKSHIVVESSVRVRNWLRRQEKIFVEWQCCRVKDYVDVARCYRCQRFGHIAKHCNNGKPSCSFCAGEHDFKECPNKKKKESVCCANCKREGRGDLKHEAGSRRCPAYEKAVKRQNEKIDYGV